MFRIDTVSARSIPDTRGNPTIETTLTFEEFSATASVPSGKSTGSREALELRDLDGGVEHAIENVKGEIAHEIIGRMFDSPSDLDEFLIELDGTPDKSRLGANAILSISIAAMRLSAVTKDIPLWKAIANRAGTSPSTPNFFVNVINGGAHADFKLPFQEHLLIIHEPASTALPLAHEAFAKLGERLGSGVPMGDEGGYAPSFDTLEKPFELLTELVGELSHMSIAIDAAASELFHDNRYEFLGGSHSANDLSEIYKNLVERFPLKSIEDPFTEDASNDFISLTASLGNKTLIVGDDLTTTNPTRVLTAADRKEINAVLIKPNQIGTLHEAIYAVQTAHAAGFKTIASHRSGETEDTFIADFAYGVGAYGIKAGGLGQKERLQKYERILAIEREAKSV